MDIAEKSFNFEQRITNQESNQDITYFVNGQEITAQVKDVRELTEEFKKYQDEAFSNSQFAIDRFEVEDFGISNGFLAAYLLGDKSVNVATMITENNVDDIFKRLKKDYGIALSDQKLQEAAEKTRQAAKINDSNDPLFFYTVTHEFQHKNNDKHNIYAPGLTPEQYGQLNQYDEISANLAALVALNRIYENKLNSGIPQGEALKTFDNNVIFDFSFYKNALQNGLKPNSDEAQQLMVQGTVKYWVENKQNDYQAQLSSFMQAASHGNDVGSIAIGNDKELRKRINLIFDNLNENEVLQKMNIDPGKFSQYLPKDIIQLSPEAKKEADNITKELTGLSLEDGKEISRRLPGSQKKDAINLVKILSGRKEAPKSFTPKQNINTARAQLMSKRDQGR